MTGESEVRDGYTRLDNGFWADARICRLRDEMPRAALIYVMALSWCSCNLTDGDIDTDQLTYTLGASEQEIETLIDIGLFQQTITGVRINEYQSNGNHKRPRRPDGPQHGKQTPKPRTAGIRRQVFRRFRNLLESVSTTR